MALTDGLVSYWKLDETSGNRADSHGSNTLTETSGSVAYATGKISNGAEIDAGTGGYLSASDSASLGITGSISFSFWWKPNDVSVTQVLVFKYRTDNNTREYQIYFDTSTDELAVVLASVGSTGIAKKWSFSPSNGTWYHIAFSFNATTEYGSLYINGSQVGSAQDYGISSINNSTNPLQIGAGASGGTRSDAVFDEFAIWSRAITGAEVTELYNGGAGLTYPSSTYTPQVMWFS